MCTVVNTAFGDYKKEVVIEKYYYYSIIVKLFRPLPNKIH
jgi:hypothetical protein